MREIDITAIRERWVAEGAESDLGLWWLTNDLREVLGDDCPEERVRRETLDAVRPLLESGTLRAVNLLDGGGFELWPGDVAEQLTRIEAGWRKVGRPDIGDVVWFIGKR